MTSPFSGTLAHLFLLSTIAGAGACVVENASHCGNRDGDATCAMLDPTRPLCSVCVAANDGCIADTVEESCKPSVSDSGVADTTSATTDAMSMTAASTSATSNDSSDPDSTDSNPVTITDPATSDPTTSTETTRGTDGESSDSATTDATTDSGDTDSSSTDPSSSNTDPATSEMTSSDQESSTGEQDCGNGAIDPNEDCDGALLNGNTCAELQAFASGQLACNDDCTLDTSGCNACVAGLGICSNPDECCSESCVGIVVTGTCG